jgi:Ca2+/H+ antiporter
MTIPAVIIIAMAGHTTLELGLTPDGQVMLATDSDYLDADLRQQETNVLQGTVHLGLFLA